MYAAEFFPDRSEVQCLHRWQKVLNPELVKGPWTQEVGSWPTSSLVLPVLTIVIEILILFACLVHRRMIRSQSWYQSMDPQNGLS